MIYSVQGFLSEQMVLFPLRLIPKSVNPQELAIADQMHQSGQANEAVDFLISDQQSLFDQEFAS